MSTIRDAIFGSSSVVILLDAIIMGFDVLLSVSDVLFPMVAVISGTLAPEVGVLNSDHWRHLLVFVAALYVINLSTKLVKRVRNHENGS